MGMSGVSSIFFRSGKRLLVVGMDQLGKKGSKTELTVVSRKVADGCQLADRDL